MRITFDAAKRDRTLKERGLDFADAREIFEGYHYRVDDRRDYGEARFVSVGTFGRKVVVLVWTPRGAARRVISMRQANDREKAYFTQQRDQDLGLD